MQAVQHQYSSTQFDLKDSRHVFSTSLKEVKAVEQARFLVCRPVHIGAACGSKHDFIPDKNTLHRLVRRNMQIYKCLLTFVLKELAGLVYKINNLVNTRCGHCSNLLSVNMRALLFPADVVAGAGANNPTNHFHLGISTNSGRREAASPALYIAVFMGVNKGIVAEMIFAFMVEKQKQADFVLSIRDDRSDEDMLVAIGDGIKKFK
ncbi:hypothetical protein QVD17_24477 [Tagetes erecta]|uniref:YABBY N-terminal domain-containing protein n=1 Tax=Tagetes erecta TaxID=13708 RepID=A0AAD8KI56_TARER|nr:hypothetical protein QVD17_24477 [Tagetes erecta]